MEKQYMHNDSPRVLLNIPRWLPLALIRIMVSFNSGERQTTKFNENPKFLFFKYWKSNGTIQKCCWRGFIWMVTPSDFVHRLESYNYTTCPILTLVMKLLCYLCNIHQCRFIAGNEWFESAVLLMDKIYLYTSLNSAKNDHSN